MAVLQPAVEKHVNDLIDAFIERGTCDFSTELAVPLPCSTFLSLFGLPLDELDSLVRWKDVMIRPEHLVPDREKALSSRPVQSARSMPGSRRRWQTAGPIPATT